MYLIDLIKRLRGEDLDEKKSSRYPSGRGKYHRGHITTSRKSKMPVFNTIKDALGKTRAGAIFSTTGSARTYVTTDGGWGKSGEQKVSGRSAKGFTPGSSTPGSSWSSIRDHAARTRVKHGTGTSSSLKKRGKTKKNTKKRGKK